MTLMTSPHGLPRPFGRGPSDMTEYLRLVLEGPMLAFGGETVDARGVIVDFPATSMLTGLLANALGWRRSDGDALASLQARLRYAARIDRDGVRLTDFQTAQLGKDDKGWTTHGAPEGRTGAIITYSSPHLRQRDYDADKRVVVALYLDHPRTCRRSPTSLPPWSSPPGRSFSAGNRVSRQVGCAQASSPPAAWSGLWRVCRRPLVPRLARCCRAASPS